MLGRLRIEERDPAQVFTGEGHGPQPLSEAELVAGSAPTAAEAMDLPDWLVAPFQESLGDQAAAVAEALRHRAPVYLRVNALKGDLAQAQAALAVEGIVAAPHPLSPLALEVLKNPRRINNSAAYREGFVELQDVASQAVVDALPLRPGARVLDFCAGGGGKALAMAARTGGQIMAHDADPGRMRDLPGRAKRAGAEIVPVPAPTGLYDVILCDVPCSGSGAWRRVPEGKWALTPEKLAGLQATQAAILDSVQDYIAPGGTLAYATCSVLGAENAGQVAAFLKKHPDWRLTQQRQFLPSDGGDGFYVACLTRT